MSAPGFNGELAAGEYWIDLFDKENSDGVDLFTDWRDERPDAVKVLASEGPFEVDDVPDRTWVKFRVIGPSPVAWPKSLATQIGFPSRIPPGSSVNSSSDTSTINEALDAVDEETEGTKTLGLALMIGGAVVLGALAVALIVAEASAIRKVA